MKHQPVWAELLAVLLIAASCTVVTPERSTRLTERETSTATDTPIPPAQTPTALPTSTLGPQAATATAPAKEAAPSLADVISVEVSGEPGAYRFAVGIRSPDTGCDQYADWWEVVGEGGELLYRRVLLHSHVGEQPFVRSGGTVDVQAGTVVWVRAHMNTGGYGGAAFLGSVAQGFEKAALDAAFAAGLESAPPLPDGCAF
jgi:hypothetical protein